MPALHIEILDLIGFFCLKFLREQIQEQDGKLLEVLVSTGLDQPWILGIIVLMYLAGHWLHMITSKSLTLKLPNFFLIDVTLHKPNLHILRLPTLAGLVDMLGSQHYFVVFFGWWELKYLSFAGILERICWRVRKLDFYFHWKTVSVKKIMDGVNISLLFLCFI